MRVTSLLLLLLALVAAVLWLVLPGSGRADDEPGTPASQAKSDSDPRPPLAGQPPALTGEDDAARTRIGTAAGAASPPVADAPPSATAAVSRSVRVLDPLGQPLAGVPLRGADAETVLATSDGAGRAEVELAADTRELVLSVAPTQGGLRFATVRGCRLTRASADSEALLVAARAVRLAGTVVDDAGIALEGAQLSWRIGHELLLDFPQALDATRVVTGERTTAADGTFVFEAVPVLPGLALSITREGHVPTTLPVPETDHAALVVVLNAVRENTLLGRVLLPDLEPAEGALVSFDGMEAKSGPDGSFLLEVPGEPTPDVPLVAGLAGFSPAVRERFDATGAARAGAPVELVLAPELAIEGRVVGSDGRPLADWNLSLRNGLHLGGGTLPPPTAESLAGGSARSDAEGRFRLGHLLDRDYVLFAYDTSSLLSLETEPIPAGTLDAEIVAPTDTLRILDGRVVTRAGIPAPGASVAVNLVTYEEEGSWVAVGGVATTADDAGTFRLIGIPAEGVLLAVTGQDVMPETFPLGPDEEARLAGPEGVLEVSVAARCHFRLEVVGADVAGLSFHVLDDEDRNEIIYSFQSGGWGGASVRTLSEDGRTPVYAVSEDARTLVLRRGSDEVLREAIRLTPGETTLLRHELP